MASGVRPTTSGRAASASNAPSPSANTPLLPRSATSTSGRNHTSPKRQRGNSGPSLGLRACVQGGLGTLRVGVAEVARLPTAVASEVWRLPRHQPEERDYLAVQRLHADVAELDVGVGVVRLQLKGARRRTQTLAWVAGSR